MSHRRTVDIEVIRRNIGSARPIWMEPRCQVQSSPSRRTGIDMGDLGRPLELAHVVTIRGVKTSLGSDD